MEDPSNGLQTFKRTEIEAQVCVFLCCFLFRRINPLCRGQSDGYQKVSLQPPNVNGLGNSTTNYTENPPYSDLQGFGINDSLTFSEVRTPKPYNLLHICTL